MTGVGEVGEKVRKKKMTGLTDIWGDGESTSPFAIVSP